MPCCAWCASCCTLGQHQLLHACHATPDSPTALMCLLLHHVAGGIPAAIAAIGLLQLLWPYCAFAGLSPDVPAATPHARRCACRCCTCCCCGIAVASAAVDQSRILRPLHYPDKPDCRTLHAAHAEAAATGGPCRTVNRLFRILWPLCLTPIDWHCSRVTP